jgi:hypothetical protein
MFFKKNGINSARDCSELVPVHSKKDLNCSQVKRWSNTMLINKWVYVLWRIDQLLSGDSANNDRFWATAR